MILICLILAARPFFNLNNYCSIPDVIVGSVAEWSKALVLGTSLFGGVGSNPTAAKNFDNPSNFED